MRNILICLFFSAQLFSQVIPSRVPVPYKFGYDGVEIIAKTKSDSTIVYSHHAAKPTIRTEVGQSIVQLYSRGILRNGPLVVNIHCATINGIVHIARKDSLISITFNWKTVKWSTGLFEEYRPKQKRK